MAGQALVPGTRWVEGPWARGLGRLVVLEELVEGDLTIPADIRTMREFVKMGSSINPDIKLTGDCPSLNISGMMPALDIQIWVEGKKVRHQHYRKPMANGLVMMRFSAMPEKIKRTSLTQEGIRILRNTSLELPPEVAAGHLTELCIRMKAAGYNGQVIKVLHGWLQQDGRGGEGGRQTNKPTS